MNPFTISVASSEQSSSENISVTVQSSDRKVTMTNVSPLELSMFFFQIHQALINQNSFPINQNNNG